MRLLSYGQKVIADNAEENPSYFLCGKKHVPGLIEIAEREAGRILDDLKLFVSDEWETQWYYGYLYVDSWKGIPLYEIYMPQTDERHIQPEWYCVDPETVGECTGLKDCNGKMIYEGDIFSPGYPFSEKSVGVVRFGKYRYGQMILGPDRWGGHVGFFAEIFDSQGDIMPVRQDIELYFPKGEIIGNIHDNPELIGGDGK